jgi:3-hydroxyisobutyrate dehydrogenase-like beta-hydroxyacid dehydrogenase
LAQAEVSPSVKERIGFVGIGAMGEPMARNLLRAGFPLTTLIHRRADPARALEAAGAQIAPSLAELVEGCPVIVTCLPTSAEVEEVVLGPQGLLERGRPGSVLVDMSTSRPASTRMLAERLRARGIALVDAPVTGGVAGAREGSLTIYVGGPTEAVERVRPALEAMGRRIFHMGDTGAGHVTKLLNNMLALVSMAALAETLPLGVRHGLDPALLLEALAAGSGATVAIPSRGERILRRDFAPTFRIDLAHKDLRLAEEIAQEVHLAPPVATAALFTYTLARSFGLSGEDIVALVQVWERLLGVEVRAGRS